MTLVLLPLLIASPSSSEETTLIAEETTLPRGESLTLEFDAVPTDDTTVYLTTLCRMDSPGLGGSMYFLELKVNEATVEPALSRTVCRLSNRRLRSPIAPDLPYAWYGTGGWRLIYAPDFEAGKKQTFYQGDPYRLVLDVTDLLNADGPNQLTLTNTATDAFAERVGTQMELVFATVTLHTTPGESPTIGALQSIAPVINRGEPAGGSAEYTGRFYPGGGFSVASGSRQFLISTRISYPNAGYNHLVAGGIDRTGQPGWTVTSTATGEGGVMQARGPDYTLVRRVAFGPRKIDVADEITNSSPDATLGLRVIHSVSLQGHDDPVVRLAGNPDPAVNEYYSPTNPSVHIAFEELAFGLLCEDDVFRNQATLFFEPEGPDAGLRTDMLYLGPGESHTLRWSAYPVAGPDYFDFINLVREDWGSNYTVEGPWCFFTPDSILHAPLDKLRADLGRLGIRYACSWGGWVDPKADPKRIGFGAEVLSDYWADYRDRLRRACAKLREARPGLEALIYYDTQRDTEADSGAAYPDSTLTNSAGSHASTEWGGRYSVSWSMFASLTNSFGKATLGAVDHYLSEIGADGLYWDEMENVAYGYPLLTYSQPDGRSCILDPETHTVQHQVGITSLLGERHRLAVVDKVRAAGGTLMGNGPTHTRALLERRVQRMVEIQHNDHWCYEGNLDSPLGYASSRLDFGNVTRALEFATLLVGTRLSHEYETTPYLFPFTPRELHHGYLLGDERIITLHSGNYGWHGETVHCTARYFDGEGKLRDTVGPLTASSETPVAVTLDPGEVCIIQRLPPNPL